MKRDETITFPCEQCGNQMHAQQAHGYYPFTGQRAIPLRYRRPAPATYTPPQDVEQMPVDADGKLRDERALKPIATRRFELKPDALAGGGWTITEWTSSAQGWAMANGLELAAAIKLVRSLRAMGAEVTGVPEVGKPAEVYAIEAARETALDFAEHFHVLGSAGVAGPTKRDAQDAWRQFYSIATMLQSALARLGYAESVVVGEEAGK